VAFNVSSDFQSIGFLEARLHDSSIDNNTFDKTRQLPHYNSSMEVQLGTPLIRNNLIIITDKLSQMSSDIPSESTPYRADDGKLHVTPQNNWYYMVDNPDSIFFPKSAAGNGDPGLLHFAQGGESDYHPAEDSPLIGRGQNLSELYTEDFDGRPLPLEGAWPVGAYQASGAARK
jgi:hypothetical protein